MQQVPIELIGTISEYLTGTEWTMLSIAFRCFDNPYFSDKAHRVRLHEAFTSEDLLQWVIDRVPWLCDDIIVHASMFSEYKGSIEMARKRVPEGYSLGFIPTFTDLVKYKAHLNDDTSIRAIIALSGATGQILELTVPYGNLETIRWIVETYNITMSPESTYALPLVDGDILGTYIYLKERGIQCSGIAAATMKSEALARDLLAQGDTFSTEYDSFMCVLPPMIEEGRVKEADVLKGLNLAKSLGYVPLPIEMDAGYTAAYMLGSVPLLREVSSMYPWNDAYLWSFDLYQDEGVMRWVLEEQFGAIVSKQLTVTFAEMFGVIKIAKPWLIEGAYISMQGVFDIKIFNDLLSLGASHVHAYVILTNTTKDNYVSTGHVPDEALIAFVAETHSHGSDARHWREFISLALGDPNRSDELKENMRSWCRDSKNPYVQKIADQ